MSLAIPLSAELESQLVAEAERAGVAPDQFAADLLASHLRRDSRRELAIALLDSWLSDASIDASEQRETGDALVHGLDSERPGQRPHFPPELEGVTW